MEFKHSNGEINSIGTFIKKRWKYILKNIFLLSFGYIFLKGVIHFVPKIIKSKNILDQSFNYTYINQIEMIYICISIISLVILAVLRYRTEAYNAYLFNESGLTVKFKNRIKAQYVNSEIVGYKIDKNENKFEIYFYIKLGGVSLPKFLPMGLFEEEAYIKLNTILKKYRRFDMSDIQFKNPIA